MKIYIKRVAIFCIGIISVYTTYCQPKITQVEYYIDNDPGYGNAIKISISSSVNLQNLNIKINPATLYAGVHIVGIRAKDALNSWSLDNKWLVIKDTSLSNLAQIVYAEYYIDSDPGYGNATKINITPKIDLQNSMFSINPSLLSEGAHIIGIRAKNVNGNWSIDNKWLFVKNSVLGSVPNITNAEYYIDNDPGYGKATQVSLKPSTNLKDIIANINSGELTNDIHILGIRAKDINGSWSLDNKFQFVNNAGGVMPVTLLNFTVAYSSLNTINCAWQTATEINASYFTIQRSANAITFSDLGEVNASGNSSSLHKYSYSDNTFDALKASTLYYRLKETDNDGKIQYSKIIPVQLNRNSKVLAYPIPAKDVLYIDLQQPLSSNAVIILYDMQGKKVKQLQPALNSMHVQLQLEGLQQGNYQLLIIENDKKLYSNNISILN